MNSADCTAVPPLLELQNAKRWGGEFQSVCTVHDHSVIWWRLHPGGLIDHVHLTWQQAMMVGLGLSDAAIQAAETAADLPSKGLRHG